MARSAYSSYSSSMYHPIREAMTYVDKKVNLAAIVLDLGFPRPSRGTDYCCSLRIVDPSYSKAGGLSVNIFDVSTHLLPHVVACGDVLLLRDVWIKPYKQEVNAVFKKNISSFALYNGEISNDFVPYQISRFEPRDTDKMIVNTLRMWLVNFKPVEDSGKFLMFREIKEGNFFVDLACKILHCHEIANNRWMVFSWDGTDLPPNNINSNLEVEVDNPLPLHIEPESLPKELLCNFPKVGSILSLTWDTDIQKNHLKSLLDGKWVKIINVSLEVRAGLWHGILSPNTKLRYTPKDDTLIQERERFCGERISSNCKRLPFSSLPWTSCVTVVDHEDDPFFTLRNVLTHSQVIGKFKCVVRVVASSPCSAENFRTNEGKYMMRLTLEDPTARIHACVYDKDGETLFGGYPENTILMQKMDRLLGVMPPSNCGTEPNRIIRNPPWVIVYILAYYTNQDDKWGSRQFRVSATKIM